MAILFLGCHMSPASELFNGFPQRISAGAANGVVYEQMPGYFALHGGSLPTDEAVALFEPEGIAVVRGAPSAPLAPGQAISPVYTPVGGEAPAVPTGQLFIRFREGERVEAHRSALVQAGFSITSTPEYAPQAAWLRARSGSIADALGGVTTLRRLPGVESVEVQLLMVRARR